MFTRVVEVQAKPGRAKELCNTIAERALPILRNQPGFVDELVLVSNSQADRVLAISVWRTQEDAERYNREQYPTDLVFCGQPPAVYYLDGNVNT